jgi:tagatose-1,6-bisphosphate aldolase
MPDCVEYINYIEKLEKEIEYFQYKNSLLESALKILKESHQEGTQHG